MRGIESKVNPNGFVSVWLHWSADETKTQKWADDIRLAMKDDNKYRQEYELDFNAMEGAKVFGDNFSRNTHVLKEGCDEIDLSKKLLIGVDWGLTPAFLLTQINSDGQWLWLREFVGQSIDTYTFLELCFWLMDKPIHGRVLDTETGEYKEVDGVSQKALAYITRHNLSKWIERDKLDSTERNNISEIWYCDVAGNQKNDKSGDLTNIRMASNPPFRQALRYKKSYVEPRTTMMTVLLKPRSDGKVGWLFSPKCHVSIEGMSGGYVRDKWGEIADNMYTHIFDAGGYVADNYMNIHQVQRQFTGNENLNYTGGVMVTKKYIPVQVGNKEKVRLWH